MSDHSLKPVPDPPPSAGIAAALGDAEVALASLRAGAADLQNRRYEHWEKLRRRRLPDGLTGADAHERWWWGIKQARATNRRSIPLSACDGQERHSYTVTDAMSEAQHLVDRQLGGHVGADDFAVDPHSRDRYVLSSLIEEAVTSSQIEGAVTTRDQAKAMIREHREPRDRSERMILNNFETMAWLKEVKAEPLSAELVCRIQERMTRHTLDHERDAGAFRGPDRQIDIADVYGSVAFVPPPAAELPERVQRMCEFANGRSDERFVHPLVRAILLHYWLAHDHPFADGNGRTARALFYWSMLRSGYWLAEFISISPIILRSSRQYYRSFRHTQTDEHDLNYFIHYHLKVITEAADALKAWLQRRSERTRALERLVRSDVPLNHRQRDLLSDALRHPGRGYTANGQAGSHRVTAQTARNDLDDLQRRGLLVRTRRGKSFHFLAVPDLESALRGLRA